MRRFTPWTVGTDRGCWTCAHAIGYDGVHLWCQRYRLVVIDPGGCWERGHNVIRATYSSGSNCVCYNSLHRTSRRPAWRAGRKM